MVPEKRDSIINNINMKQREGQGGTIKRGGGIAGAATQYFTILIIICYII